MHQMQILSKHEPWVELRPIPVNSEAGNMQISGSVREELFRKHWSALLTLQILEWQRIGLKPRLEQYLHLAHIAPTLHQNYGL